MSQSISNTSARHTSLLLWSSGTISHWSIVSLSLALRFPLPVHSKPHCLKCKHVPAFLDWVELKPRQSYVWLLEKTEWFKMTAILVNLENQHMPLLIPQLNCPHDNFNIIKTSQAVSLPSKLKPSLLLTVIRDVAPATQSLCLVITVSNKKKEMTGNEGCTEGVCRHVQALDLAFVVSLYLNCYWHTLYCLETHTLYACILIQKGEGLNSLRYKVN